MHSSGGQYLVKDRERDHFLNVHHSSADLAQESSCMQVIVENLLTDSQSRNLPCSQQIWHIIGTQDSSTHNFRFAVIHPQSTFPNGLGGTNSGMRILLELPDGECWIMRHSPGAQTFCSSAVPRRDSASGRGTAVEGIPILRW